MTNDAINKILNLPRYLERNSIYQRNNFSSIHFGVRWADDVIRFFDSEPAATSVVYPADIYLCGKSCDGELEVHRDGSHQIRLLH